MGGMTSSGNRGPVRVRSKLSFAKTVHGLFVSLERRGMAIHARIDHAANAAAAGLELRPALAVIFGFPGADSPLIIQNQAFGIELPRQVAVWEDETGAVWIGYDDPVWLGRRHGVRAEVYPLLDALKSSFEGIAIEAGGLSGNAIIGATR